MWAALLGLMAVCSTIVLSAVGAVSGAGARCRAQELRPIEEHVEVAVGGGVDALHAGDRRQAGGQVLGDRPGRLAQRASQFEGHRRPDVAQGAVGRDLERDADGGGVESEAVGERGADRGPEPVVQGQHHDGRGRGRPAVTSAAGRHRS